MSVNNALLVRERGQQERDLARDWWQLPPQTVLSLEDGRRCLLLASGQPGGPAGPDVRDVVLRLLPVSAGEEGTQLVGDVEFHLRASDWFAHGHHTDPRYNTVILHVVLYPDSRGRPTRRQDGTVVPLCSLLDLPQIPEQCTRWPCQERPLAAHMLTTSLLYAGLQRFNQKSQVLRVSLETAHASASLSSYDACLLPALAEGLGYGRDRAFFRAVGLRLVGQEARLPEPLGRAPQPAPVDARRLGVLAVLSTRWRRSGAWCTLRQALLSADDVKTTATALRAALHPLNRARADILIANIVLPFATAVAALESDPHLASRAHQTFLAYPGLASNRITRRMSLQLSLEKEPVQACLQQGLQQIYASTCQAKRCQDCLCGGQRL